MLEGLSRVQRLRAECSSGTRGQYGVLGSALVDPLDRGPRLDNELGRLAIEIAVATVTAF